MAILFTFLVVCTHLVLHKRLFYMVKYIAATINSPLYQSPIQPPPQLPIQPPHQSPIQLPVQPPHPYPKLRTASKSSTLAVKLAREAFFGKFLQTNCTVQGCRGLPTVSTEAVWKNCAVYNKMSNYRPNAGGNGSATRMYPRSLFFGWPHESYSLRNRFFFCDGWLDSLEHHINCV